MAQHTDRDALNLAIIENREISGEAQSSADVNAAADKRTQLLLKILGDMQQSDKINESTTLAEHLYDKMRSAKFSIRKVRQAPFFVLRGAGMPAVLVEMGYITEASDAKQLSSAPYRKRMMDSLAAGIFNYLNKRPGEGGRS
jgi:N-acetylmuramoyl-L-alanine amidase